MDTSGGNQTGQSQGQLQQNQAVQPTVNQGQIDPNLQLPNPGQATIPVEQPSISLGNQPQQAGQSDPQEEEIQAQTVQTQQVGQQSQAVWPITQQQNVPINDVQVQVQADQQVVSPAGDARQVSVPAPEPQVGRPAAAKEAEFVGGGLQISENIPIVEVREQGELPVEVEGWVERVEQDDVKDFEPIVHDGQTILSTSAPQQVDITLPISEDEAKKGLHHKVFESVRWMAEWCVRLVKKYHGKVAYKRDGNQGIK